MSAEIGQIIVNILAILVLLLRFSVSQMDVPTRQSYTMAIVPAEERSSAAGIMAVARTTGGALAPVFAGRLFASPALINLPFFIAGTLKIIYDLLFYRAFVRLQPPEEVLQIRAAPDRFHLCPLKTRIWAGAWKRRGSEWGLESVGNPSPRA